MIIKNYRELCKLLNTKEKGGNTRKAQIKEIERYIKFRRRGHEFIIEKIYKEPLAKIDKRKETVYAQYVEKLILDLLIIQQEQNNKSIVNLSTNKLFEILNMINKNYIYGSENKQRLAEYLNMDKEYIKDFYNITYPKLIYILESAFKRLSNKMLIHWEKVITISKSKEKNGIVDRYYEKHYIANDQDVNMIIQIEKEVAEEMELKTKQQVIFRDKLKEYNKKVIDKIQKNDEKINYYYRSYKIYFNSFIQQEKRYLEGVLKEEERKVLQEQLNDTIVENYKNDNEKRYNDYLEKYIGEELIYNNQKIRVSDDYIKNNNLLVDTVINQDAKWVVGR